MPPRDGLPVVGRRVAQPVGGPKPGSPFGAKPAPKRDEAEDEDERPAKPKFGSSPAKPFGQQGGSKPGQPFASLDFLFAVHVGMPCQSSDC